MKRLVLAIVVVYCSLAAIAAEPNASFLPRMKSPATEIAELEDQIAKAKAAGQMPDPAWTARIRELIPLVKGHASKVPANLETFQTDGGFAPGAVIRPTELTPLEAQIHNLEIQLSGGPGSLAPDPVLVANLKEELNVLYGQREINQPGRNPLDQGNDACPGTVVNGIPFTDTGTTVGYANNYNPISPCGSSASNDVVYAFTPPSTQSYNISLAGSSYDTYLYVNTTGACPGFVQVACNDDYSGLQSFVSVVLNAGQTYYIIVDGFGSGGQGAYVLNITDNCNIDCQPGDIQECAGQMADSSHARLDCNGGCNNSFFSGDSSFQYIQPCQTVCGEVFTYDRAGVGRRDIDLYKISLSEPCQLSITLSSEVPLEIYLWSGACWPSPMLFETVLLYPCSTFTYITDCIQAGVYTIDIQPRVTSGINDYREYRARVDLVPCSGCRIDAFLQAPGAAAGNTCGAGNDNSLLPSQDYTYCVNIPYDSDWSFSTCNDDSIWDSYIYLSTQCSGGVLAQDDDGCGGVGLSVINCVYLTAGTYYLTVEGFLEAYCGPFVLNVTECLGSCCYGDPDFPSCDYISQSACSALGGTWTNQEPCSTGACNVRPDCGDGEVMFSQVPHLPGEPWEGYQTDSEGSFRVYEDYSVSSAIGSIRFWGAFGPQECDSIPHDFEITFIDSINNVTQTYNVTLTATVLPLEYFNYFTLLEYTAELNPPCTITDGWLSIAETSSPSCYFNWSTTVLGNGLFGWRILQNETQYEVNQLPAELAFCLEKACLPADSVTIQLLPDFPDAYTLRWWQPAGLVRAWWSTDPSAVFPATYTELFSFSLPEGLWINSFYAPDPSPEVIYVLTVDCGAPPTGASIPANPEFMKQEETK